MIFILLCLATLLAISNAIDSNYIVYSYKVPAQADVLTPYPIGVCVNYEIVINFLNQPPSDPLYGIFYCNGAKNEVNLQAYGTDGQCTFGNEDGDLLKVSDDAAESGKLGAYNCLGTQNYAVIDSCAAPTDPDAVEPAEGSNSGELCCDSSLCTPQTAATDVCVWNEDNSVYNTVKCDRFGVTQESYTDNVCTAGTVFDEYDEDLCEYFTAAFGWDIHRRLRTCVEDTIDITNTSYYCAPTPDPTSSPTMEPTTITDAPSRAPSPEGDVPVTTEAPEDDDSKVGRYFIGYVLSLAIVVGCFMVN